MQPGHAISHCGEDARRKVRQKYGARLNYYVYEPRPIPRRVFRPHDGPGPLSSVCNAVESVIPVSSSLVPLS
jgi:hypothetical protein